MIILSHIISMIPITD